MFWPNPNLCRARVQPDDQTEHAPTSTRRSLQKERSISQTTIDVIARLAKVFATVTAILLAAVAGLVVWSYYVVSPWTRDGRTRVQVANIAPQVSGQIAELRVVDNQFVHKDEVLYVIDPFDFRTALVNAQATLQMRVADLLTKRRQAERRLALTSDSTSVEEKQSYASNAAQAEAAFRNAQAQFAQAQMNFVRTEVRSPVNGTVTNLQMRVGNYATSGTTNLSVIDADSYWIDGYFEETKMPNICIGESAHAKLMGFTRPIDGVVETITRGISTEDAASSTQGLPNVNPVYTWVRLAQRIPVRIRITHVPSDIPLVAGMTATVMLDDPRVNRKAFSMAGLRRTLNDLFGWPSDAPAQACDISNLTSTGPASVLTKPEVTVSPEAGQINPGLAPGMAVPPTTRSINPQPRPKLEH